MANGMLTEVHIDNFKSLINFEVKLSKFTCLIGLNSAGKSTVLQAIDFLANIAKGSVDEWLQAREWDSSELLSKLNNKKTITFKVDFVLNDQKYIWRGSFNATKAFLNCSSESIVRVNPDESEEKLFWVIDSVCRFVGLPENDTFEHTTWRLKIEQKYKGSFLSSYKGRKFTDELNNIRNFFQNIKSLELLAPSMLRKAARDKSEDIGIGGEKLSAFLATLDEVKKVKIAEDMKQFDSSFDNFNISTVKGGWKKLSITEHFIKRQDQEHGGTIEVGSKHLSDGLLRLMSVLAQSSVDNNTILFDEIENGINPEFMEIVVHMLQNIKPQVIVTTHSPILLNFIDDEIAKDSVCFVYKNEYGETQQIPFFKIKQNSERLEILGVGESVLDVSLVELADVLSSENKG